MTEQKTLFEIREARDFDNQANELRKKGWHLVFFCVTEHPIGGPHLFGVFEREVPEPKPESHSLVGGIVDEDDDPRFDSLPREKTGHEVMADVINRLDFGEDDGIDRDPGPSPDEPQDNSSLSPVGPIFQIDDGEGSDEG